MVRHFTSASLTSLYTTYRDVGGRTSLWITYHEDVYMRTPLDHGQQITGPTPKTTEYKTWTKVTETQEHLLHTYH